MEGSIRELSLYRMERAEEMLIAAEENLSLNQIRTSLNRSYYAVFHAIRALNCLEGFDSSKHSGVIAFFNKTFIKEGKLDKSLSIIIKETLYLREKADYDDFYIVSREEAKKQLQNAQIFVEQIENYLASVKCTDQAIYESESEVRNGAEPVGAADVFTELESKYGV